MTGSRPAEPRQASVDRRSSAPPAAADRDRLHAAVLHPAAPVGGRARRVWRRGAVRAARSGGVQQRRAGFSNVAAEGIFGLMVPIAALVIGDAVLGAELHAGTFHFTWRSPGPTWELVVGRWSGDRWSPS